jgi:peptidoglycan hydrolase-like protein with peptidoglycan-binding domain
MKRKHIGLLGFAAAALLAGATSASAATQGHGLMKGLDGGHYLAYKPSVVRKTQQELEHKGLYKGKIDGILGPETMHATAEFQKQNGLHVSGVPTPATRHKLATG